MLAPASYHERLRLCPGVDRQQVVEVVDLAEDEGVVLDSEAEVGEQAVHMSPMVEEEAEDMRLDEAGVVLVAERASLWVVEEFAFDSSVEAKRVWKALSSSPDVSQDGNLS